MECEECVPKAVIQEIREDVKQILLVISGPIGKPEEGVCSRVNILESWRKASTTRTNFFKSYLSGIVVSVITAMVCGILMVYTVNRLEQQQSIKEDSMRSAKIETIAKIAAEKVIANAKLDKENKQRNSYEH